MDQQFSKNALLTFLETVVRQGLVNSNTAAGWKAAFSRILEDVPDQEDVRKIDVPTAIKRYHNKHPGELKPTSLKEYERRLVVLLKDFTKYAENPSTFKPRGRTPIGESIGTTPRKKVGAANIAPGSVVVVRGTNLADSAVSASPTICPRLLTA